MEGRDKSFLPISKCASGENFCTPILKRTKIWAKKLTRLPIKRQYVFIILSGTIEIQRAAEHALTVDYLRCIQWSKARRSYSCDRISFQDLFNSNYIMNSCGLFRVYLNYTKNCEFPQPRSPLQLHSVRKIINL